MTISNESLYEIASKLSDHPDFVSREVTVDSVAYVSVRVTVDLQFYHYYGVGVRLPAALEAVVDAGKLVIQEQAAEFNPVAELRRAVERSVRTDPTIEGLQHIDGVTGTHIEDIQIEDLGANGVDIAELFRERISVDTVDEFLEVCLPDINLITMILSGGAGWADLSGAFVWANSPQGHAFWSKADPGTLDYHEALVFLSRAVQRSKELAL